MKNILIVHGWMHSAARYEKLKMDLEKAGDYKVTLYEFPGFGETKAAYKKQIMAGYVKDMRNYLSFHKFDIIIAHSLGGSIILKSLNQKEFTGKLVLLSPEYLGIPLLKPFIIFAPIIYLGLFIAKIPGKITELFIKLLSLFTINSWKDIDDRIVKDVRRADAFVAAKLMFSLAYDSWRVPSDFRLKEQVVLCVGENDRIIRLSHMEKLKSDIKNCRMQCFKGIGHTVVLENYTLLLNTILNEVK